MSSVASRIKRNRDIRLNEPIRSTAQARQEVRGRGRRNRYIQAGLAVVALGCGALVAEASGVAFKEIDSTGKEITITQSEGNDAVELICSAGLILATGGAYAERKSYKASLRRTERKYAKGIGFDTKLSMYPNYLQLQTGNEELPGLEQYPLVEDYATMIPSLSTWVGGFALTRAAAGNVLEGAEVGIALFGAGCIGAGALIAGVVHKESLDLEKAALRRIDQLDPKTTPEAV